jgi:hypothetical protein
LLKTQSTCTASSRGDRAALRWAGAIALLVIGVLPVRAEERDRPDDPAAESALRAAAGKPGFRIHRTRHFLICYNTDATVLRDFVARVEATRRSAYRFLELHDVPHRDPAKRLEILFFDEPQGFLDYAERIGAQVVGAAGFYQPASNRAAFYNASNAVRLDPVNRKLDELQVALDAIPRSRRTRRSAVLKQMQRLRVTRDQTVETINRVVVQHEVAHQVFFNAGLHHRRADNPAWLVEGLACLFETPPSAQGAGIGAINQYRLIGFRTALTGTEDWKPARAEDFRPACGAGRMVPLRRLIGDGQLFTTTSAHAENRYAQAWGLVQFLQRRKRDDLSVYLAVLARRPTDRGYSPAQEVAIFEEVFGPLDDRFEQQWLDYVLDQRVRAPRSAQIDSGQRRQCWISACARRAPPPAGEPGEAETSIHPHPRRPFS